MQITTVHENLLTYRITPYRCWSFKVNIHSKVLNQLPLSQLTYCKQNRKWVVMNQGLYVFTQLIDFLPRKYFKWLVKKYDGNKYVKSFTCWNHMLVLLFGQLSNREGLRDLIVTIAPFKSAFHHLGFGKNVSRSNLSMANETRDVSIFQEFADKMVSLARDKRIDIKDFFLSNNVYLCIWFVNHLFMSIRIWVDETASWQRWSQITWAIRCEKLHTSLWSNIEHSLAHQNAITRFVDWA